MRNIEQRLPSWLIHQFVLLLLVGCQALTSGDSVATIGADLTMYASESDSIRAAVTADGIMAVETVVAASTRVAELAVVNAALGATLRANYTGTPKVEAVVVSAEDMGTSLEDDMMDYTTESDAVEAEMRVSNFAAAAGIDSNSGCSSGTVQEFSHDSSRIYVTALVTALRTGTTFQVNWYRGENPIYGVTWQSLYSKSSECVWFFATPEDFAFTPGNYTAKMIVDGVDLGSTTFDILAS